MNEFMIQIQIDIHYEWLLKFKSYYDYAAVGVVYSYNTYLPLMAYKYYELFVWVISLIWV